MTRFGRDIEANRGSGVGLAAKTREINDQLRLESARMGLSAGTRLGPYEIAAQIGVGASVLNRTVAT